MGGADVWEQKAMQTYLGNALQDLSPSFQNLFVKKKLNKTRSSCLSFKWSNSAFYLGINNINIHASSNITNNKELKLLLNLFTAAQFLWYKAFHIQLLFLNYKTLPAISRSVIIKGLFCSHIRRSKCPVLTPSLKVIPFCSGC